MNTAEYRDEVRSLQYAIDSLASVATPAEGRLEAERLTNRIIDVALLPVPPRAPQQVRQLRADMLANAQAALARYRAGQAARLEHCA